MLSLRSRLHRIIVIPAKAGIQKRSGSRKSRKLGWIPAFAGMTKMAAIILASAIVALATPAAAEPIKDLGGFAGIRSTQLIGYGIVSGLDGTGDDNMERSEERRVGNGCVRTGKFRWSPDH